MKLVLLVVLLLPGCAYMAEGKARCQAMYGPTADFNGLNGLCTDLAAGPNPAAMMLLMPYMNQAPPSHTPYTPPVQLTPMNRCTSTMIGNQLHTTCY